MTACGGGGGSAGLPPAAGVGALIPATLEMVATTPSEGEIGVALSTNPTVSFDGSVQMGCLGATETGLFELESGERIPGSFKPDPDRSRLSFVPERGLPANTMLELRMSPLTCSTDGRLLEATTSVVFRTRSDRAPAIVESIPAAESVLPAGRPQVQLRIDTSVDPDHLEQASARFLSDLGEVIDAEIGVQQDRIAGPSTLLVRPLSDLPSSRSVTLQVQQLPAAGGLTNPVLELDYSTSNRGSVSTGVVAVEPATDLVANGWNELRWNRSLDRRSLDDQAFLWSTGSQAPTATEWRLSSDGRRLALRPRTASRPGSTGLIQLVSDSVRDSDGVQVAAFSHSFAVVSASAEPTPTSTTPDSTDEVAPGEPILDLRFDRSLHLPDPAAIRWTLTRAGADLRVPVASMNFDSARRVLRIRGGLELRSGDEVQVRIEAGPFGIRGARGAALERDFVHEYRCGPEGSPQWSTILPEGLAGFPLSAAFVLRCSEPIDRASLDGSVSVASDQVLALPIQLSLADDDRTLRLTPIGLWGFDSQHTVTLRGGPSGVVTASGRWTPEDQVFQFRSGFTADQNTARATLSVEGIPTLQAERPQVPDHGFALELASLPAVDDRLDPASVHIVLTGPSEQHRTATLASLQFDGLRIRWPIDAANRLDPGPWTATAEASDLSGNPATIESTSFQVRPASAASVPFERLQLVRVRFDLDRDQNGIADFRSDLIRVGLASADDASGLDQRMERIVRDGVLSRAHSLFRRNADGSRRADGESVPLRFVEETPTGVPFMEIACGGLDPEGVPGRVTGDPSSGTLGRAFFDSKNSSLTEAAVGTSPGLGVFPAEVYLFEARIHDRLAPGFLTAFGRSFAPLAPDLGGVPLGDHPLDQVVMDPDFDPDFASSQQQARYRVLFGAADDWATVIGTILAHEVGHAVGMTEPGEHAIGLNGDDSLHNRNSAPTDIMAATLGFDAMLSLNFEFRALNLAYLRHRVVLQ